jgi:acylphosphatase
MPDTRAHVLVSGRVQGVSFRYYTQRQANAHNVTGWVRNLADGRVEALFEGDEVAVNHMVDWCRRGPSGAYVTDIRVTHGPFEGSYRGFNVRY